MTGSSFLCCIFEQLAVSNRRQFVQSPLPTFVIVEIYVAFNGSCQAIIILKTGKIVHFAFENAPETFHGVVVNAATDARHALCHSGLVQFKLKLFTGILKTSVTMKQRVSVRILRNDQIKGFKYEVVIVVSHHGVRDNTFVLKVEDCAQIQFFPIGFLLLGDMLQLLRFSIPRCICCLYVRLTIQVDP